MDYKKVPQQINDVVGDNVKKLAQLFPSAVKDGEVDFEALKEELGSFTEVGTEKYELTWAGKMNAKRIAQEDVIGRTLKFIPEDSKYADTTENLYIEGDNLEVLKLLRQNYYGAVKMIYIDPPYNTGNDFVYNDIFLMSKEESDYAEMNRSDTGERLISNVKSSNRFHANWMNMIYSRLKLAKDLLSDNGLVFISIDSNEEKNLTHICDEVFGADSFISKMVWKNKYGAGGGTNGIANIHEYILVYGKSQLLSIETDLSEELQETYKGKDNKYDIRGGYVTQPLASTSKGARPNLMYTIVYKGKEIKPPAGGRWVWSKEKFDAAYANDEIVINETKDGYSVRFKQYLKDENGVMRKGTVLSIINEIYNQEGSKEATELLGDKRIFGFPKPTSLIKYLFKFIINGDEDNEGIYLDFFSGSASTADAIMQMNAEDNGKRKFIMVQLPEACSDESEAYKAGYKNICEIGKERIRRAGEKIKSKHPDVDIDIGFKVFRVADTNIKWNSLMDIGQLDISQIESTPDLMDFMPNTKDIDVVYELMLRQRDVALSESMELLSYIGSRTYLYASSFLVCLETEVTESLVEKVAAIDPLPIKFIFRDSAFKDDIAFKDETFRRLKALVEKNSGESKPTYTVEFI